MRTCLDCPASLEGAHHLRLRCVPCAKNAEREAKRRYKKTPKGWASEERYRLTERGVALHRHNGRKSNAIRHKRYGRTALPAWKFEVLLKLQNYTCVRCLEPFEDRKRSRKTQLDHIDPENGHTWLNFQALCQRCNGTSGKWDAVIDYRIPWMKHALCFMEACA